MKNFIFLAFLTSCSLFNLPEDDLSNIVQDAIKANQGVDIEVKPIPKSMKVLEWKY